MKKNLGFSLIELIITVLILGILSTATAVSISNIRRGDAIGFAKSLTTALERARLESLSRPKETVTAVLSREADGYYITYYYQNETEKKEGDSIRLGTAQLGITLVKEDGITSVNMGTEPADITKVEFKYSKSTGAFLTYTYQTIQITGRNTASIKLVKETGRCFVQ